MIWIIIVILCLLTTTGGALIALRLQHNSLDNSRQEREAWQQAQEGRQRTWEVRQGKHILEAEKKLADQLKGARYEWRDWNAQMKQEHQEWRDSVDLEKELLRLPHVEQIELTHQAQNGRLRPKDWRPPTFYKADLRGRDLSYRYMERADLREAQLIETNLYMSDLAGASLTGANLQEACLIGSNLSGADLRGADLSGVNLMVADLHNAVLHGTNLTGARNLTPEQLQTAIYDSTTIIDSAIDITLPRIPGVQITRPELLTATASDNQPVEEALPVNSLVLSDEPVEDTTPAIVASEVIEDEAASPLLSETSISEPVEITTTESAILTSLAEENTDMPVLSVDSQVAVPESQVAMPETGKKASKKRAARAKQAAATPVQLLTSRQEETGAQTPDEQGEIVAGEETEDEELRPNKIIQWQARLSKTRPLAGSGEQNKGDKAQKKQTNNRATNFNSTPGDAEDQQAQAN